MLHQKRRRHEVFMKYNPDQVVTVAILEEILDRKLEEKLEQKLEHKLEQKLEQKFNEKFSEFILKNANLFEVKPSLLIEKQVTSQS